MFEFCGNTGHSVYLCRWPFPGSSRQRHTASRGSRRQTAPLARCERGISPPVISNACHSHQDDMLQYEDTRRIPWHGIGWSPFRVPWWCVPTN